MQFPLFLGGSHRAYTGHIFQYSFVLISTFMAQWSIHGSSLLTVLSCSLYLCAGFSMFSYDDLTSLLLYVLQWIFLFLVSFNNLTRRCQYEIFIAHIHSGISLFIANFLTHNHQVRVVAYKAVVRAGIDVEMSWSTSV